jgi:hypothetical protein
MLPPVEMGPDMAAAFEKLRLTQPQVRLGLHLGPGGLVAVHGCIRRCLYIVG